MNGFYNWLIENGYGAMDIIYGENNQFIERPDNKMFISFMIEFLIEKNSYCDIVGASSIEDVYQNLKNQIEYL